MSRYIDADKLALKWMLASPKQKESFRQIIDEEPTADVVEVVRCKDYKWWTKEKIGSQGRCGMIGHYPRDVFYCSHGERKEK